MATDDQKKTYPRHGGEHFNPAEGPPDETMRGRKGGPDIDVEKREKELARQNR